MKIERRFAERFEVLLPATLRVDPSADIYQQKNGILNQPKASAFNATKEEGAQLLASQECFKVLIPNVSVSGLQILLSNEVLPKILPNIERKDIIDTVPLIVEIELPEQQSCLTIRLGVIYLRRHSMDDSLLGCRFEWFYQDSARRLAEYLATLKQKQDGSNIVAISSNRAISQNNE